MSQGHADSEYVSAKSFHWDATADRLIVFDESLQKILTYSPDGVFEKCDFLQGWNTDVVKLPGGFLAVQSARASSSAEMMAFDINSLAEKRCQWNLGSSLAKNVDSQSDMQFFEGGYIISKPFDNSIFYYKNGKIYRRYLLSAPMSIRSKFDDYVKLRESISERDCYFEGKNLESRNYLFLTYIKKKSVGLIVFCKNSESSFRLTVSNPSSIFRVMQLKNVVSVLEDSFSGIVDLGFAASLPQFSSIANPNNLISEADMEKLRSVKPDDNPIIVLFKLRPDL